MGHCMVHSNNYPTTVCSTGCCCCGVSVGSHRTLTRSKVDHVLSPTDHLDVFNLVTNLREAPTQPSTANSMLSAVGQQTQHYAVYKQLQGLPGTIGRPTACILARDFCSKIPFGSLLLQRPHPRQQAFIPLACWLLHTYLHQPQVVLALHRIPKHRVAPVQQVGPAGGEFTLLQKEKDLAAGTVGRKKSRRKGTGSS